MKHYKSEEVSIDTVNLDPNNLRKHTPENLRAIKASLERFGQHRDAVIQKSTRIVLIGNGMVQVMRELGWETVTVKVVEDNDTEAAMRAYADNRSGELAAWNADISPVLETFDDGFLGDMNVNLDALKSEEAGLGPKGGTEKPYTDDIDYEAETNCRLGDTWLLGDHRVLVADAFDIEARARLIGSSKVHVLFSDPPFGVNVIGKKTGVRGPGGKATIGGKGLVKPRAYQPVIGDDEPFDPAPFLNIAPIVLLFGAQCYASRLPDNPHWLVWDKHPRDPGQDALSFGDCELVWTNVPKRISVKIYRHHWTGLLREGKRDEELQRRIHPTQKPVGLCATMLEDYAPRGATVLDPFLGSGSTLIACEKTGRTCLGTELSPHYAEQIAKRWSQYVGEPAVLLRPSGAKKEVTW